MKATRLNLTMVDILCGLCNVLFVFMCRKCQNSGREEVCKYHKVSAWRSVENNARLVWTLFFFQIVRQKEKSGFIDMPIISHLLASSRFVFATVQMDSF